MIREQVGRHGQASSQTVGHPPVIPQKGGITCDLRLSLVCLSTETRLGEVEDLPYEVDLCVRTDTETQL